MIRKALRLVDPRSIARDVAGVFEAVFPQLSPGIVAHLNRIYIARTTTHKPISDEILQSSTLQRAMLFEVAVAVGETLLRNDAEINWEDCLSIAVRRQQRFFDAAIPNDISDPDKSAASIVGENLYHMVCELQKARDSVITFSPPIPGYRWIGNGVGDFAIGPTLIEVKCTAKNFSSADYRQIMLYWLLSFISSIEKNTAYWTEGILLNPRIGIMAKFDFHQLAHVLTAGKSPVECLQLFEAAISERHEEF